MKTIKTIGLAALTALMAMAFVGAGSAMAEETQLCTTDTSPCSAPTTSIHAISVGRAKLLTSLGTVECNVLFESTSVGALAAPQVIKGNFTFSNCELVGVECEAKEQNGPAELLVLKEGHETAAVTGEGLVKVECGKTLICAYTGERLKGTAKGPLLSAQIPDNGEVSLSGQELIKEAGSGFICPKTAKLDIAASPLVPVYISG